MDRRTADFLSAEGLVVKPKALYLVVRRPTGVLLEDIGPLLAAVEVAYRRLLAFSIDDDFRSLLVRRVAGKRRLHGVSRSANVRYESTVAAREKRAGRDVQRKAGTIPRLKAAADDVTRRGEILAFPRTSTPERIQLTRSKLSSPGFFELAGDPTTLLLLVTFLGYALREWRLERHHNAEHTLALKSQQRADMELLLAMGYSRDEVEAAANFMDGELATVIQELQSSRSQLAPGDDIDPSRLVK